MFRKAPFHLTESNLEEAMPLCIRDARGWSVAYLPDADARDVGRLLAAAPTLLKALRVALATIETHTGDGCQNPRALVCEPDGGIDYEGTAATLREAIAAAE